MSFQPLSQRLDPRPDFDGPYEGVPPWLWDSVRRFVEWGLSHYTDALRRFEELRRESQPAPAWPQAVSRAKVDPVYALDLVDYLLLRCSSEPGKSMAGELRAALTRSGSVWSVEAHPLGEHAEMLGIRHAGFGLVKREPVDTGAARDVVETASEVVGRLLGVARSDLYGRSPDPKRAYQHVTEALEAAMAPVIAPDDGRPSLGKMVSDLAAKPEKWRFELSWTLAEGASPSEPHGAEVVVPLLRAVQKSQARHAGQTPVTAAEAESAYLIAISLCAIFLNGSIARVP